MNEPYDIIQTVQLTEKATLLSEKQNKYVFRVSPQREQDSDQAGDREALQEEGRRVNTCNYAGKEEARAPGRFRPQAALEESDRDPEGRREDRTRLISSYGTQRIFAHSRRRCVSSRCRLSTRSRSRRRDKSLIEPKKRSGGRNNNGRLTSRHIGGGHKQKYRKVDFKRRKHGIAAEVIGIEYDPNRSARIALIKYADGEMSYILAPDGLDGRRES